MHFHTDTGPWLANWPRDTSSKKIGIPAMPSMVRYGIKKAPGRKRKPLKLTVSRGNKGENAQTNIKKITSMD